MENTSITQLVESWINVTPDVRFREAPEGKKQAVARGNMLGSDTSDPDSEGSAIYTESQNLPTAVASILSHVQDRADFHPTSLSTEQLAVYFQDYIKEVDKTPFFALFKNEKTKSKYESKNYNVLIDQIVSLYEGISKSDENAMKESISNMAKSVFSKETKEDWKNIFSQSTIDMSNPLQPRIFIYYTTLHMKYVKGKSEVNLQEFEVNRTEYVILPDLIRAYANKLTALDKKSVDDWMGDATSPERKGAKLCFDPLATSYA
ncbi:hypothetical protein [Flavivirga spongiicola]|uniref:Uncharacterized protein n=1 Tax=Flavivirga spongiicola TaxID=421621 RepID=A0ABU7XSC8_9FLAO|nr:hypothetical protein [Flavivirga sp. MEBiC05379]MDO5978358.1 hypothetical protein [Flavivirga sp. MEBiC05379]